MVRAVGNSRGQSRDRCETRNHEGRSVEARLGVARTLAAGVNSNLLTDEDAIDELSGNSVLNGIPVEVAPATA